MTIKQLFKKVNDTNEIIKPLAKSKAVLYFSSNLSYITESTKVFDTYESFEKYLRLNFKNEADKMLRQTFSTVRERFHFDNKGYLSLIITKEEV